MVADANYDIEINVSTNENSNKRYHNAIYYDNKWTITSTYFPFSILRIFSVAFDLILNVRKIISIIATTCCSLNFINSRNVH